MTSSITCSQSDTWLQECRVKKLSFDILLLQYLNWLEQQLKKEHSFLQC